MRMGLTVVGMTRFQSMGKLWDGDRVDVHRHVTLYQEPQKTDD